MRDCLFRKSLVMGLITLFFLAIIAPIIAGNIGKIKNLLSEEENDKIVLNTLDTNLVGWWSFDKVSDEGNGLSFDSDDIPPEVSIFNPDPGYIYLLGIKIPQKIEKWVPENATACIGGFFLFAQIEAYITDEGYGVDHDTVYAYIDQKPDIRSKLNYKGLNSYEGNLLTTGIFLQSINTANLVIEAKDYNNNLANNSMLLKFYIKIIG